MALPSILSLPAFGAAHTSHPSPPSSESDGDSIDTQSTTTSSYTGKTLDVLTSHVYIGSDVLRLEFLQGIFSKHCEGGLLTVCIDNASGVDPQFNYTETSLGINPAAWRRETLGNTEYHAASWDATLVASELTVSNPLLSSERFQPTTSSRQCLQIPPRHLTCSRFLSHLCDPSSL